MWKLPAAVLVFALAVWAAITQFGPAPARPFGPAIGRISLISGEVKARSAGASELLPVTGQRDVFTRETFSTGPDSSAEFEFNGGGKLKLLENAKLVAESTLSGPIHVTILIGEAEVIAPGDAKTLVVYRDGSPIDGTKETRSNTTPVIVSEPAATPGIGTSTAISSVPDDLVVAPTAQEEPVSTPAPTPPRSLPKKGAEKTATLSNDEISRIVGAQGSRLQRCFLDHVKRKNTTSASGTITIAFVIRTSGKVDGQRVVSSPFDDLLLHNCVTEVIARTPFPGFQGDPIVVSGYPLKFE